MQRRQRFRLARYFVRANRWGLLFAAAIVVCAAIALFITFDRVAISRATDVLVRCGSIHDPSPAVDCARRLDQSRVARSRAGVIGVASAVLLALHVLAVRRTPKPVVESTRLTIRRVIARDAEPLVATIDDEVVERNGWLDHIRDDMRATVRLTRLPSYHVICERSDGHIIGAISGTVDHAEPHRCTIGMWLDADHRGRGMAVEALTGFTDYLHERGLRTVAAETSPTNAPMCTTLERAGFQLEGARSITLPDGTPVEARIYAHRAAMDVAHADQ